MANPWQAANLSAEEEHRAVVLEPESQTVEQLNRSVRVLREMLYQEKLRSQAAARDARAKGLEEGAEIADGAARLTLTAYALSGGIDAEGRASVEEARQIAEEIRTAARAVREEKA